MNTHAALENILRAIRRHIGEGFSYKGGWDSDTGDWLGEIEILRTAERASVAAGDFGVDVVWL